MRASPNSSPAALRASERPSEWRKSISPGSMRPVSTVQESCGRMPSGYEPFPRRSRSAAVGAGEERLRVARDGSGEPAVGRKQQVDAREERPRAAGAAEDAVERREHGRRRRVDVELRAKRRVRDGHDEPGRHPVARGVAEEHGQPPVRQRDEVVDVAADGVGDLVVGADRERRRSAAAPSESGSPGGRARARARRES